MATIYSEKKEDAKYDFEGFPIGKTLQRVSIELRWYEEDCVLESDVTVDGEQVFEARRAFSGYEDRNKTLRKAITEFNRLVANHPYFSQKAIDNAKVLQSKPEAPDDDGIGELTAANANAGIIGAL